MLCYFNLSGTSKTTVALVERVAISGWVGLSLSRIGKRWHALDENEYEHPNIAISETRFLGALMQH